MVKSEMLRIGASLQKAQESKSGIGFHPFMWLGMMAVLKIAKWRMRSWPSMEVDEKANIVSIVGMFDNVSWTKENAGSELAALGPFSRIAMRNFAEVLKTARSCIAHDHAKSEEGWNLAVALDPTLAEEQAQRVRGYDRTKVILADMERVPRRRTQ